MDEATLTLVARALNWIPRERREEFYGPIFDAALEAERSWDGRSSLKNWTHRIVRYRIKDRWRELDPLSRSERRRYNRKCKCGESLRFVEMICPNCGYNTATDLTAREIQVWEGLASGEPRRQIAKSLGLTVKTFESHLTTIRHKLGVHGQSSSIKLARMWYERVLLQTSGK